MTSKVFSKVAIESVLDHLKKRMHNHSGSFSLAEIETETYDYLFSSPSSPDLVKAEEWTFGLPDGSDPFQIIHQIRNASYFDMKKYFQEMSFQIYHRSYDCRLKKEVKH